jgi:hypothetical protein
MIDKIRIRDKHPGSATFIIHIEHLYQTVGLHFSELYLSMESRGPLKETAAWKRLEAFYAEQGSSLSIPAMFQADPDRFSKFSRRLETPKDGPFLVDFSKVRFRTVEQQLGTKLTTKNAFM